MPSRDARVRVLLALRDEHAGERLAHAVEQHAALELAGRASDGDEALQRIRQARPEVAVLDVGLSEPDGIAVLSAAVRDDLSTRVLLLSECADSALVYRALAEGAAGILPGDSPTPAICDAVLAVARGETVLSPEGQSGIAKEIRTRTPPRGLLSLSVRENEVLALVADGLSAPDIGRRLHLSPATVKGHLSSLYEKLGVKERAAAVAEAMRRGLLE